MFSEENAAVPKHFAFGLTNRERNSFSPDIRLWHELMDRSPVFPVFRIISPKWCKTGTGIQRDCGEKTSADAKVPRCNNCVLVTWSHLRAAEQFAFGTLLAEKRQWRSGPGGERPARSLTMLSQFNQCDRFWDRLKHLLEPSF